MKIELDIEDVKKIIDEFLGNEKYDLLEYVDFDNDKMVFFTYVSLPERLVD